MDLLIATTNQGKLREYQALLADLPLRLLTPLDVGLADFDVEETADTFAGNAMLKAAAYAQASQLPALADDSGIVVDALDGMPGVYSARYAEDETARIRKLLSALKDVPDDNRAARFVCVVALALPGKDEIMTAEGIVEGRIAREVCAGQHGFGYDPVFIPEGFTDCLAALPMEQKNQLSHRGKALRHLRPALIHVIEKAI